MAVVVCVLDKAGTTFVSWLEAMQVWYVPLLYWVYVQAGPWVWVRGTVMLCMDGWVRLRLCWRLCRAQSPHLLEEWDASTLWRAWVLMR